MTPSDLQAAVESALPSLLECSVRPQGDLHVRTPLYRPDGDGVDLFVAQNGTRTIVTDYGDTLGWLFSAAGIGDLTAGQCAWIDDVNRTLGTKMHNGQLHITCEDPTSLADALTRVAQASIRIADLALALQHFGTTDFPIEEMPALTQHSVDGG